MKSRIASDNLSWLNLSLGTIPLSDLHRQKKTTRAILRRLYDKDGVPGVILADEVGMGKTYVALGVAAAIFSNYGQGKKVIVLAPGRQMQRVWWQRWEVLRQKQHSIRLPEGHMISDMREAGEGISFGSYEEMKHTTGGEILAAYRQASRGKDRPRGIVRRRLRNSLFEAYGISVPSEAELDPLPRGQLRKFWRENYDKENQDWKAPWGAYKHLQRVVLRSRRARTGRADLIIFDEAHRLGGSQRQLFFQEVVYAKTKRTLFVSATPFSLSVDELIERVKDLYVATGSDETKMGNLSDLLQAFRGVVRDRSELSPALKDELEQKLGRYLVRSLWQDRWQNGERRRTSLQSLSVSNDVLSKEQAFATFALEKKFTELENGNRRVHIAVDRETLCSSYGAIRAASERRSQEFNDVVRYLPANGMESPKLEFAASKLPELVIGKDVIPEKVVVFCNRTETIRELWRRLERGFSGQKAVAARRWANARKSLLRRGWRGDWKRAKLACHLYSDFTADETDRFIGELEKRIQEAPLEEDYWEYTWGLRRRVEWASTLTGERAGTERPNEYVQFAFNLPGPPYVLICSQVGKESIDLHRWCRKIVHYDHAWNPAVMEQRVGRIDRINSRAMRNRVPIEIYYFAVKGTYEERIFNVVKERMEMMRVLLGAGEWLAEAGQPKEEFRNTLENYRLDFAPSVA